MVHMLHSFTGPHVTLLHPWKRPSFGASRPDDQVADTFGLIDAVVPSSLEGRGWGWLLYQESGRALLPGNHPLPTHWLLGDREHS